MAPVEGGWQAEREGIDELQAIPQRLMFNRFNQHRERRKKGGIQIKLEAEISQALQQQGLDIDYEKIDLISTSSVSTPQTSG